MYIHEKDSAIINSAEEDKERSLCGSLFTDVCVI